jgi:glycosyltransferase involved in cell wall biosynthesis
MIDYLEHIVDTDQTLRAFTDLVSHDSESVFVLSVPNAAHVDVAAKLLFGRFDYTRSGLLDYTHVRFFDERHFIGCMAAHGWQEIGHNDFELRTSDQHFPTDLPAIAQNAALGRFLREVATAAHPHAYTQQFIRAFRNVEVDRDRDVVDESQNNSGWIVPVLVQPDTAQRNRRLSVIMRTQGFGDRLGFLDEALCCMAGQSDQNFEILLAVHGQDAQSQRESRSRVDALLSRHALFLTQKITVIDSIGGGRSRPLNDALDHAQGDLVSFLDDDDLVSVDFVATLNSAFVEMPGAIIRTVAAARFNEHLEVDVTYSDQPATIAIQDKAFDYAFSSSYDFIRHYWRNETPIHSIAIPMSAVDSFGWRFDESLDLAEDWHFVLRAVALLGVHDTHVPTSVYNRWEGDDTATGERARRKQWDKIEREVVDMVGRSYAILPHGTARQIHDRNDAWMYPIQTATTEELKAELDQRKEIARREWISTRTNRVRWVLRPKSRVRSVRRALRPRTRIADMRVWWRDKRSK